MSDTTTTYTIDPAHSTARFWVRHLAISKVHGEIPDVTGNVTVNTASPESSSVQASLNVASLTTGNSDRDGHLKSGDFLDTATYPTITFSSTSVKALGGEEFEITGDLTIKGVTKSVTLKGEVSPEVKNPFGGYKIGVSLSGQIVRDDFGITWNQTLETGGLLVGKEIHLQIDAEIDRPE
jgi:polyisoprenoid-binding protein YceI